MPGHSSIPPRNCAACGQSFRVLASTSPQRFCSHACSVKAINVKNRRGTITDRFWSKVNKTETCWLWTASKNQSGFGLFGTEKRSNGTMRMECAHRFSWQLHYGPIPEGARVVHICPSGSNPACVNPEHLQLHTEADEPRPYGPRRSFDEVFWDNVHKTPDCWLWTAGKTNGGYGKLTTYERVTKLAHRISWEIHFGEVPEGLCVLHHCDNPSCVRPDHLFLGTLNDNKQDCVVKERHSRGEKVNTSKLTEEQVKEIRQACAQGANKSELAKRYGVDRSSIFRIARGETWSFLS